MKCNCGGKLVIVKTEQLGPRMARRVRKCDRTGTRVVSHERMYPDGNNQYEQRLVDYYRNLDQPQRDAMWALLRTFNPERNNK